MAIDYKEKTIPMNVIDILIQRNEAFASSKFSADLKIIPSLKTMIIVLSIRASIPWKYLVFPAIYRRVRKHMKPAGLPGRLPPDAQISAHAQAEIRLY